MTHPEELLAGYVDGTLDGDDRVDVERHLPSCARCAGEVAAARRARAALRALPTPVAPDEVGSRAIAAARAGGAPASRGAATAPAWSRWAAGLAAAAAVVLGLVVVVPNVVGGGEDAGTAAGGAEAADASGGLSVATTVERVGDLAPEDLAAYASQARDLVRDGAEEDGRPVAPEATDAGVEAVGGDVAEAARCLGRAFPSLATDPVRLLAGSFGGTPAYVGVYLVASQPGGDPDVIQVIAAARRGCSVLSSAAAPVAP
jgi:anti-sigma factor RsiW